MPQLKEEEGRLVCWREEETLPPQAATTQPIGLVDLFALRWLAAPWDGLGPHSIHSIPLRCWNQTKLIKLIFFSFIAFIPLNFIPFFLFVFSLSLCVCFFWRSPWLASQPITHQRIKQRRESHSATQSSLLFSQFHQFIKDEMNEMEKREKAAGAGLHSICFFFCLLLFAERMAAVPAHNPPLIKERKNKFHFTSWPQRPQQTNFPLSAH